MTEYVPTTGQMLTAVARSYSHEQAVAWMAAHDAEVAAKAVEDFAERLVRHQEHCYGSVLPDVTEVVDDLRIIAAEYRAEVGE